MNKLDFEDKEIYFIGNTNDFMINFIKYSFIEITSENYSEILSKKDNNKYNILFTNEFEKINNFNFIQSFEFNKVYDLKNIFDNILHCCQYIYITDYDYNFLKIELNKALTEQFDTLIVGNSYPLCGIDTSLLNKKSFNLSMHSQDLYYSYTLAKKCIESNKSIKRCIVGVGQYTLYNDISKSTSDYCKNIMKKVYIPLTNENHNSNFPSSINENMKLDDFLYDNFIKEIFDLKNIEKFVFEHFYKKNPSYFENKEHRKKISYLRGASLKEISNKEKELLCDKRIKKHNKFIKYNETYYENIKLLKDFLNLLNINEIETILIYFPFTETYMKKINQEMKKVFYNTIDTLSVLYNFKFIDFNKNNIFNEDDFVDFDHLNEKGCSKICNYLNNL